MAGARDTDWTHIHVAGDRDAAAPYVSYARKLLGYVKQDAGYNGLMTHGVERQLSDGAVIRAEIVGGIPRITINPPGGGNDVVEADWFEGVVMLYRHSDHPATAIEVIDPRRYGVNALPLYMADNTEFYNRAVPPKGLWYTLQQEFMAAYKIDGNTPEKYRKARDKALKKRANGLSISAHHEDTFHENTEGFCVSYRGGMLGKYFVAPSAITDQNGSSSAFHRGRAVFGRGIISDDDWRIFGAAIKGSTLYVVVSIPTQITPYAFPENRVVRDHNGNAPDVILPSEDRRGEVFMAPVYAAGIAPVKILKVDLAVQVDAETNQAYYKYASHEVLYEGSLRNADGPWVFDDAVTHAVCIARPDECRLSWHSSLRTYPPARENAITPSTSHLRHHFDIKKKSMSSGSAGDVIAEDSGKTLRLERTGDVSWDYVWDGGRVTAYRSVLSVDSKGADRIDDFEQRILIDADVKRSRYIFEKHTLVYAGTPREAIGARRIIEVHCDGAVYHPTVTRHDSFYDVATQLPNPHPGGNTHYDHIIEIHRRLETINISAYARVLMCAAGVQYETWGDYVMGYPLLGVFAYAESSLGVDRFGGAAVCIRDIRSSTNAKWNFFLTVPDAPDYGSLRLLRHGSKNLYGTLRSGGSASTDDVYLAAFELHNPYLGAMPFRDSFVFSKGLDIENRRIVDYKAIPHSVYMWGPPPPQQKRRYTEGAST